MNYMKTKIIYVILALFFAGALNLHAQVAGESYKYLSKKEKKANAERMIQQKYDFFEMTDEEVVHCHPILNSDCHRKVNS